MAAHQAPPSLGFSRQEHWSGLPFPSPMQESEKWKWSRSSRVRLFATPWTAAYQAPPSMGFSRQEYWSGLPLPSPFLIWEDSNIWGDSKHQETGTFRSSCLGCVLGWFSEETERIGSMYYLPTYLPNNYRELAHVVLEAEKSQNLPHASWRPRKARGIVWRLESRGASGVDSGLNLKAWESGTRRAGDGPCPSSLEAGWWLQPSSRCLFCSGPNWIG